MLEVATPSLQAEQILASDCEAGKHYLNDFSVNCVGSNLFDRQQLMHNYISAYVS